MAEPKPVVVEGVFVEADSSSINNFAIPAFANELYSFTESDGITPFVLPIAEKGVPQCELCLKKFTAYSALYAHQGKLCVEDTAVAQSHIIHVHFSQDQLKLISDALKSLGKVVHTRPGVSDLSSAHSLYVTHEAQLIRVLLNQLFEAHITKYNIERWYPALAALPATHPADFPRPVTAATIWLELSDDELRMIKALCAQSLARNIGMERRLTNSEMALRESLEDKLTPLISESKAKIFFARLSTRSPKDGVSLDPETKAQLKDDNAARMLAKMKLLQVTTSEQVLDLFGKSQRIMADIALHFQWRLLDTSSGKLCTILREWQHIETDHEFRCYVRNGRITGISQYQCYQKFERLQRESYVLKCRAAILDFHRRLAPHVAPFWADYIIDIAVNAEEGEDKMWCSVIEFNPFGASVSSGSALFDWALDHALLYGDLRTDIPPIRVLRRLRDETNAKEN